MNRTPGQQFHHRSPAVSCHRQRGAAFVFAGIAIVALLASLALAIDVGQLFYAQRDLEKQAALAALSGAQVASGCRGSAAGVPATLAQVQAAVDATITQNPASIAGAGDVRTGLNGHNYTELGWVNTTSGQVLLDTQGNMLFAAPNDGLGHFFPLNQGNPNQSPLINAVRVNLSRPQPTLLIPFLNANGSAAATGAAPTLVASATAQQQALGTFTLGTTLADLSTANSPFLNMVVQALACGTGSGSAACTAGINLSAAGFQGLLGTNITLGQLATAVGVSSNDLSSLLNTTTTLPGVLNGLSPFLSAATSGTSSTITGLLASSNVGPVHLGDIIGSIDTANPNVPIINLLDLIVALGEDATANNGGITPINLPLSLNLPGITPSVFLKIGAPAANSGALSPGFAPAGVAHASTAEVTMQVRIDASSLLTSINGLVGSLLKGLGLTVNVAQALKLGIDVDLGPATATLNTLLCPDPNATPPTSSPTAKLSAITGLAKVTTGTFTGSASSDPALSTTSSLPLISVALGNTSLLNMSLGFSSAGVGSTNSNFNNVTLFNPPTGTPPLYLAQGAPSAAPIPGENPQTVSSNQDISVGLNLNVSSGAATGLVGAVINTALSGLTSSITGLITPLTSEVNMLVASYIDPTLAGLGIQVGTATVTMTAVATGTPLVVTHQLPILGGS